ncbi:MAG: hypothetical protein ACOC7L_04255, partial [Acidobacteriota bacterium]
LEEDLPGNVLFCGDGAIRHAGLLTGADCFVLPPPAGFPTAEGLLRVNALHPDADPVSDEPRWEPDYLRPSSARPLVRAGASAGSLP